MVIGNQNPHSDGKEQVSVRRFYKAQDWRIKEGHSEIWLPNQDLRDNEVLINTEECMEGSQ